MCRWCRRAGGLAQGGRGRGHVGRQKGSFAASPLDDASQDATFNSEPVGDPPMAVSPADIGRWFWRPDGTALPHARSLCGLGPSVSEAPAGPKPVQARQGGSRQNGFLGTDNAFWDYWLGTRIQGDPSS